MLYFSIDTFFSFDAYLSNFTKCFHKVEQISCILIGLINFKVSETQLLEQNNEVHIRAEIIEFDHESIGHFNLIKLCGV